MLTPPPPNHLARPADMLPEKRIPARRAQAVHRARVEVR
jgi:hypothetical protein